MTRMFTCLAAGAATLAVAVPAAAQTTYQSPYAQSPYAQPAYPPGYYPQQGYPQGQYYPQQGQDGISQVINQLLGNRYQTNDRNAVERCATAAVAQANARYRPNQYGQRYDNRYPGNGYGNQGYYPGQMRVTAITDVQRRNNGVRVSGLLDSNYGARPPYGNAYGYQGQGYYGQRYAGQGDLTFRCNVAYNGAVSDVRVRRNQTAYNRGY